MQDVEAAGGEVWEGAKTAASRAGDVGRRVGDRIEEGAEALTRGIDLPDAAAQAESEGGAPTFDPARAGHIFRQAAGHVQGNEGLWTNLFRETAANPANERFGLLDQAAVQAGVRMYTQMWNIGQIWVTVRDNVIQNAGLNLPGATR